MFHKCFNGSSMFHFFLKDKHNFYSQMHTEYKENTVSMFISKLSMIKVNLMLIALSILH